LSKAQQDLSKNRDKNKVAAYNTALNAAQTTFDTAAKALKDAEFYYKQLQDQLKADKKAREDAKKATEAADRTTRQNALNAKYAVWDTAKTAAAAKDTAVKAKQTEIAGLSGAAKTAAQTALTAL